MFHRRTWLRTVNRLFHDGIELSFTDQMSALEILKSRDKKEYFDMMIAELMLGVPGFEQLIAYSRRIEHRIGISPEIPSDFTTFPTATANEFKRYLCKVSLINYVNGIRFLAAQAGMSVSFESRTSVRTTGIYHPHALEPFDDPDKYRTWLSGRLKDKSPPWIGLLFYYSQLAEENTADIDAVIQGLESHGLAPLCVFCAGVDETENEDFKIPLWLSFFRQAPGIDVLLNMTAGRLLKKPEQNFLLELLDVPIIQLLRSHSQAPDQWHNDPQGLPALTTVYSLAQPETCGVITPVLIAGSRQEGSHGKGIGYLPFMPIEERILTLCCRLKRWIRLQRLANREKQITFVLHNNPCKGAEATVGMAMGLDTFESLALVLKAMKAAGYDVGQAPHCGRDILNEIMSRKATTEFRWTTVDEIINKGGALYKMDSKEYKYWFDNIPESSRRKVFTDWDVFPGKGMVYNDNGEDVLVITGIQYGNIRIIAQPKRGCYGAKCTGEVCRILHDPLLSPPHHWLATYKYIRDNSDAVVHFGTEGSLEFLPGKQTGLCDTCFSEISIGDLPNLYVYIMDATGEGLIAKRRGQAVLVDHLTPVYRPAPMDEKTCRLEALLEQYHKAHQMGEIGRKEVIGTELIPLLLELHIVDSVPQSQDLMNIATMARQQITLARQALMPEGLHLLGKPPDSGAVGRLLATMLRTSPPDLPDIATIAGWLQKKDSSSYDSAAELLDQLASGRESDTSSPDIEPLRNFCRNTAKQLKHCDHEITNLLAGMEGRYIPPGLSGSLSRSRIDLLPTGRNFFATDVTALPTQAAWAIGRQMADKLLCKFLNEENRFPESIGINIWSTDAFKSDGELLCQILYLMGAHPLWHPSGLIREVEAIPLDELILNRPQGQPIPRPRVDVTVQTSSIMRDMVPNFCELIDRAVVTLSFLDEPEDRNFIRKHTRQEMDKLREQTEDEILESKIRRLATLRIFSSAPGAYGLGVGLALDASAWNDAVDLAEVYINGGGFAYGFNDLNTEVYGMQSKQMFAEQLARIDVAYMKQSSAEYDLLDCGCYAVCQGGMAAASATVGKHPPRLYWGDSTLPENADVRDLGQEIQKTARAKLLNQAWIDQLKHHGYQGAQIVAGQVNTLFKWSATTNLVPKGMFESVTEKYILNEINSEWLRENNPYALEEITRRLLEAASRGLWEADADKLSAVQATALEIEGYMEEIMGEVQEDFQGNKVEVLTVSDVEKWEVDWKIGER